ncbi:FAD binding domain-containing protein [Faecalicatena sp. AGMB00832]|uniref:FAD binding domain-containing protein n=1 Tax=Faecalicatena faecalis TaxID=2726362 RepID=A0ABS6DAQ2_9FIRM|nr:MULTISPECIES: FAD binding domain-containing protein [Faecalicatena]MBU3878290.1 FAD binding domain-containing protein [Faecalicatena faecalis]MCI6464915.1 FAD binding domain-containing protein [Faecalicatena sp.]MDY5619883.1 FAD binding domain-containing protein [Lachnospiraceae bacterium]
MLQYKKYYMPKSKEELFELMENNEHSYDLISGGTDLYAEERTPFYDIEVVIDISGIEEFSTFELKKDSIIIGANTRIQQFLEKPEFIDNVPILRHAACYFADQQIREIATIGGNLANASPCGDMIPPLLTLDAVIHTAMKNKDGVSMREIPAVEFVKGVGKTSLLEGEVIQSVSCPIQKDYGCAFKKVGLRRSLCISAVNSAFLVKADKTKQYFEDVRIAFGGIAPVPTRLKEIEERLKGRPISKEVIQKVADYIPEDIVRSRSRREYRRTVVRNFLMAGLYESLAEINIVLR